MSSLDNYSTFRGNLHTVNKPSSEAEGGYHNPLPAISETDDRPDPYLEHKPAPMYSYDSDSTIWRRTPFKDFWLMRSDEEKFLIKILSVCTLIVAGLLLSFFILALYGFPGIPGIIYNWRTVYLCSSSDCVRAGGGMLSMIDKTFDPCENFYMYACGGWEVTHPLPKYYYSWDTFAVARDSLFVEIKDILQAPVTRATNNSVFRNLRSAYSACINDTLWSKAGVKPLIALVDSLGGFPILNSEKEYPDFNWINMAKIIRNLSIAPFIGVSVTPNDTDSSEMVVYFGAGRIFGIEVELLAANDTTERDYFIQTMLEIVTHLSSHEQDETATEAPHYKPSEISNDISKKKLKRLVGVNGYDRMTRTPDDDFMESGFFLSNKTTLIYEEIMNLWNFNVRLAKIMPEDETQREPFSITGLQKKIDRSEKNINLLNFIKEVFADTTFVPQLDSTLVSISPQYFKDLFKLISKENKKTIANAVMTQVVLTLGHDVTSSNVDLSKLQSSDSKNFVGRLDWRSWVDCGEKINTYLGAGLTSLYIKTNFEQKNEDKENVELLVQNILASLQNILKQDNWMGQDTQWSALKKTKAMQSRVGFSENFLNEMKLKEFYQPLGELNETNHFENVLKLRHFITNRMLQTISENSISWAIFTDLMVNAFYNMNDNAIQIPTGIIRPPYFWRNSVQSVLYGSLGAIISHEILHGFDLDGRLRNWKGDVSNWWSDGALNNYLKKAKCFEKQYSRLPITQTYHDTDGTVLKVDAQRTNSENIADAEGLALAWRSYQMKKGSGFDKRIVGLDDITTDQLFFVAYAQMWCSSYTDIGLSRAFKNQEHTPHPFRVNGAVRNVPQFAEAFQCTNRSLMRSNITCHLWN